MGAAVDDEQVSTNPLDVNDLKEIVDGKSIETKFEIS